MSDMESSDQETTKPLVPEGSNSDLYLAFLIRIISDMPMDESNDSVPNSISLSVVVGGQMWAGDLVSAASWSSQLAAQIRESAIPNELADAFASIFDQFKLFDQEAIEGNFPFGYVHLLNAVPVLFDGNNAVGGISIRFRLEDVQGWTMGRPQSRIN